MARVPTAAELGLGQRVRNRPDQTPFQNLQTTPEAFGAGQGRALQQVGQQLGQLSGELQAAHTRIQNREDTVARATEFNQFFNEASQLYQSMETQGDLTKSQTAAQFNSDLNSLVERYTGSHQGSADSMARFATRLEDQRAKFAAQASSRVQQAQREVVDSQWGSDIGQIAAGVASGQMDLAAGLKRVEDIADEYAGAYATDELLERAEAAQGTLILNTVQRLSDLGQVEQAETLINTNPEVFQTLDPISLSKLVRGIELQKIEKSRLQQEDNLRKQNILAAAGVQSPDQLSPQTRMLYYTGQLGPAPKEAPKEVQLAREITMAEQKYGPDSAYAKNLKALAYGDQQRAQTPVQKLFNRRDALIEAGATPDNQELRVVQSEIDKMDPVKIEEQQARDDFPKAQSQLASLQEETNFLVGKIDEALMLATNEDTVEAAMKSAADKDYSNLGTGNIGMVASFLSGTSDAAELDAALMPLRANTVLNTMDEMRAMSSSGATGLGAMSEPERVMLRDSEGALDLRVPDQLVKTLLRMRQDLPRMLAQQEESFRKGFSSVLGTEAEVPDPTDEPVRTEPDGRVRINLLGLMEDQAAEEGTENADAEQ